MFDNCGLCGLWVALVGHCVLCVVYIACVLCCTSLSIGFVVCSVSVVNLLYVYICVPNCSEYYAYLFNLVCQ